MPSPSGSAVKLRLQRAGPGARASSAVRVLGRLAGHRRRSTDALDGREVGPGLPLVAPVHDRGGHLADPAQPDRRAHPRHAEAPMTGPRWATTRREHGVERFSRGSGCSTTAGSSPRRGAAPSSADMGADVIRVEKREGGEDRWVQAVDRRRRGRHLPPVQPQQALARPSTRPRPRAPRSPASWWPAPTWSSPTCRRRPCAPAASTTRRLRAGQARHHPGQRHRLRRGRPLQRPDRVRRHRPGDVGRRLPPGPARPADPHGGALRRLRHGA